MILYCLLAILKGEIERVVFDWLFLTGRTQLSHSCAVGINSTVERARHLDISGTQHRMIPRMKNGALRCMLVWSYLEVEAITSALFLVSIMSCKGSTFEKKMVDDAF